MLCGIPRTWTGRCHVIETREHVENAMTMFSPGAFCMTIFIYGIEPP